MNFAVTPKDHPPPLPPPSWHYSKSKARRTIYRPESQERTRSENRLSISENDRPPRRTNGNWSSAPARWPEGDKASAHARGSRRRNSASGTNPKHIFAELADSPPPRAKLTTYSRATILAAFSGDVLSPVALFFSALIRAYIALLPGCVY